MDKVGAGLSFEINMSLTEFTEKTNWAEVHPSVDEYPPSWRVRKDEQLEVQHLSACTS